MSVAYQIIRSNRKTIAIQILPSGLVVVRAPRRLTKKEIESFVESKHDWIQKHLNKIKTFDGIPFENEELEQLRKKTAERLTEIVPYFASAMGVSYNRITVRKQRTRWGSCSSKGNLNFNCLLSLVPPHVFDYVVVHELCHLKQMNHSAAFWSEVENVLPDFDVSKRWLKEEGGALINRIPD